jgi:hypothetical protein
MCRRCFPLFLHARSFQGACRSLLRSRLLGDLRAFGGRLAGVLLYSVSLAAATVAATIATSGFSATLATIVRLGRTEPGGMRRDRSDVLTAALDRVDPLL